MEDWEKLHPFYTEESKILHCSLEAECIIKGSHFFFPKKDKINFVLSNVNSVVKETLQKFFIKKSLEVGRSLSSRSSQYTPRANQGYTQWVLSKK